MVLCMRARFSRPPVCPSLLRQGEGDEGVAALGALLAAAAGGDQDVLFAGDGVGAGGRVAAGGEWGVPEQFAGFRVVGVEAFVFGAADEDETAGGDDRAAEAFG